MLGRTKRLRQPTQFIRRDEIPEPPGAAFYRKLNALLVKHDLDRRAEKHCPVLYPRRQHRAMGYVGPAEFTARCAASASLAILRTTALLPNPFLHNM
ncbi:hypothetical protein JCM19992_17680 [Thermostilla marina]